MPWVSHIDAVQYNIVKTFPVGKQRGKENNNNNDMYAFQDEESEWE